jgi:Class II Aldolase and Adducin N-terminal domain
VNYSTDFRPIRDDVSAQEWQTRIDLAACYRLVDHYGMSDLIYNHITARIPSTEHLLINLYGLLYKEIMTWRATSFGSQTPITASTSLAT